MNIQEVLKEYQERLINLSSRNMSLCMNRLTKKSTFDILSLAAFYPEISKEFEAFLLSDQKSYKLLDNHQKWFLEEKKAVDKELREQKNTIEDSEAYALLEEKTLAAFEEKYAKYTDLHKSIEYLNREIASEQKETGIYNLYLAYGFVVGHFMDDSNCRAPLGLIPLALKKEKGEWFVEKTELDILINKVFLLSAIKNNGLEKNTLPFEYESESDVSPIEQLLSFYKKQGIEIDHLHQPMSLAKSFTAKESYGAYRTGELQTHWHMILGRFPTSNAIYEDYQVMYDNGLFNNQMENLLYAGNKLANANDGESALENERQINEAEFHFISSLDFSQELAVKRANDHEHLVIFGPPGTGKSETIANIISDALSKNQRVLMVSQKRAALDVLYNRLSPLNEKMALIHDADGDKRKIYEKISNTLETHMTKYGDRLEYFNADTISEINKHSSNCAAHIESELKKFDEIKSFLASCPIEGCTTQQLLHKAWSKVELIGDKLEQVKVYHQIKGELPDLEMREQAIKKLGNNILEDKIPHVYIENETLKKQHELLTVFKDNFSFYDQDKVINSLKTLNNTTQTLDTLASQSACHKEVAGALLENAAFDLKKAQTAVEMYTHTQNAALLKPVENGLMRFIKMIFMKDKILDTEQKNKLEYEQILEVNKACIEPFEPLVASIDSSLKDLALLFNNEYVDSLKLKVFFEKYQISEEQVTSALEHHERYFENSRVYKTCDNIEKTLVENAFKHLETAEQVSAFIIDLYEIMVTYYVDTMRLESQYKQVSKWISQYDQSVAAVKADIIKKNGLTPKLIHGVWDKHFIETYKNSKGASEFKRQANKKRMLQPIRKSFENHSDLLMNLFPCFMMGPEIVSQVLPLEKDLFDIVIFDEASQMYVEEALPSILRAKKVVIAGDDKQLKSSGLFSKRFVQELDADDETVEIELTAALEEESLLDLAKSNFISTKLNFHYRSAYLELINFSNHAFYGGTLRLAPNTRKDTQDPPIKRIKIEDGLWQGRANIPEAQEVIKVLKEVMQASGVENTFGIITFNVTQKDLIEDMIELEMQKDPEFDELVKAQLDRKRGDEDVSLFIKNIENVQGDERDVILFSTAYAKDERGRLVAHFGSLSQSGGENRLNVAISRAKKAVYLITSFEPEELLVDNAKNLGPIRFKQYLQYARYISEHKTEEADRLLKSISMASGEVKTNAAFDSPFEEEVFNALESSAYEIHKQVGASGYKIDLAIYDPMTSTYVLGIECDGATYHSTASARERDVHRQKFLESRGWNIVRIWSTDWWEKQSEVVDKLKAQIDTALLNNRKASEATGSVSSVAELSS